MVTELDSRYTALMPTNYSAEHLRLVILLCVNEVALLVGINKLVHRFLCDQDHVDNLALMR